MKCKFFLAVEVVRDQQGNARRLLAKQLYQNRPSPEGATGGRTVIEVELELPLEILEPKVVGQVDIEDVAQTIAELKQMAKDMGIGNPKP